MMNTDYRPTNSWDFRLRAAKLGELVSVRSLAALSLTVALLAFLATLAALQAPPLQAQTVITLVSNTHQDVSTTGTSFHFQAQSFETGATTGGYTVSEVDIHFATVSGRSTSVSIRENDAGEPGALVATLTNPGTLTADSLNTFPAPDIITLDASTTYWVSVNEGITSDRASLTVVTGDDETGETGWSIGDSSLYRSSEMDGWLGANTSLLIEIRGTSGGTTTLSNDAKLSGLTLEDGDGNAIPLDTEFASDDYEYDVSVANGTDAVKLTAAKNDANAMVVITNDDDIGTPGEAELDLSVGSNELTVTVTAEDTTTSLTYTVTVTRAAIPTLVSNTHLTSQGSSSGFQAQSFETGANAGAYTVSEVDIRSGNVSGRSTSVKIRANNSDNEPGDLVATLTNPGTLTSNSLNTFTAPPGTTLAASTTYWITVNEGITSNRAAFGNSAEDDETGETGWTIGNGRLFSTTVAEQRRVESRQSRAGEVRRW